MKYIDDTTLITCNEVVNGSTDPMQSCLQEVEAWCDTNHMTLNAAKSKDVVFYFGENNPHLVPLRIQGAHIDSVEELNLLGVTVSSNLKWDSHIDRLVRKASKALYLLIQLKRSGSTIAHLRQVYMSMVRPILEYATPVWHPGITKEGDESIERIQKRAVRIILPDKSYDEGCRILKLDSLANRRYYLCEKLFIQVKSPEHKLHRLLPPKRNITYDLRKKKQYNPPKPSTNRKDNAYINWALLKLQKK